MSELYPYCQKSFDDHIDDCEEKKTEEEKLQYLGHVIKNINKELKKKKKFDSYQLEDIENLNILKDLYPDNPKTLDNNFQKRHTKYKFPHTQLKQNIIIKKLESEYYYKEKTLVIYKKKKLRDSLELLKQSINRTNKDKKIFAIDLEVLLKIFDDITKLNNTEEKYFKLLLFQKEMQNFLYENNADIKKMDRIALSYKQRQFLWNFEDLIKSINDDLELLEIYSNDNIDSIESSEFHNINNRIKWDGSILELKKIFSFLKEESFFYLNKDYYKDEPIHLDACFNHNDLANKPDEKKKKINFNGAVYELARFINWLTNKNIFRERLRPSKPQWIKDHFTIKGEEIKVNGIEQALKEQKIEEIKDQQDKVHFIEIMKKKNKNNSSKKSNKIDEKPQ